MPMLAIDLIPCLRDNYAYLVRDSAAGLCAVVDPSEAAPVRAALAKAGARLTHILNTHHHFDHTGGNLELKAEFGAQIVGPAKDRDRIPGIDVGVDESAPWNFGPHRASVLEIPAHTRAHIAFHFPDSAAVFTGDTLLIGGTGRADFPGGEAGKQYDGITGALFTLPDSTLVFPAHDYRGNQ